MCETEVLFDDNSNFLNWTLFYIFHYPPLNSLAVCNIVWHLLNGKLCHSQSSFILSREKLKKLSHFEKKNCHKAMRSHFLNIENGRIV